jgi:NADPH2:quinone reductase
VHGFAMFNAPTEAQQGAAADINRWMAEGRLKAQVDRILPLSKAAEAHRLQEESTVARKSVLNGKIVLKPE